jgi:hypothetical protein
MRCWPLLEALGDSPSGLGNHSCREGARPWSAHTMGCLTVPPVLPRPKTERVSDTSVIDAAHQILRMVVIRLGAWLASIRVRRRGSAIS